jgi:hypothetical protein
MLRGRTSSDIAATKSDGRAADGAEIANARELLLHPLDHRDDETDQRIEVALIDDFDR